MSQKLGVSETHEWWLTWQKAGGRLSDIDKMSKDVDLCRLLLDVIHKRGNVTPREDLIDTDVRPSEPYMSRIIETVGLGKHLWHPNLIGLFSAPIDREMRQDQVSWLVAEAKKRVRPFSAAMLDYLLLNPELVPSHWAGKVVIFPATLYDNGAGLHVYRCYDCQQDPGMRNRLKYTTDVLAGNERVAYLME